MAKSPSQKSGLVDAVKAAIAERKPGFLPWYQRVAPEHVGELLEVRRQWQAGELGSKLLPVARAISDQLAERGIARIGAQGVQDWLQNRAR